MTHLGADFDMRPTGRPRGGGLVGGLGAKQCNVVGRLVKEMKGQEEP